MLGTRAAPALMTRSKAGTSPRRRQTKKLAQAPGQE